MASLQESWAAGLPVPANGEPKRETPPPPPRSAPKATPNEKLARDATNMLLTGHGIVNKLLMIVGLRETAAAIAACDEPFEELAYDALLLDPNLCRSITRFGGKSGKLALAGAYVVLAGAVAPVAAEEMKDRVAAVRDKMRERKDQKIVRVDPES